MECVARRHTPLSFRAPHVEDGLESPGVSLASTKLERMIEDMGTPPTSMDAELLDEGDRRQVVSPSHTLVAADLCSEQGLRATHDFRNALRSG